MSRFFTEDEVSELVYSHEVSVESNGSGRWTEYMTTVIKTDDGKFYSIDWEQGLTENQEDIYESKTYDEVFPHVELKAVAKTVYRTTPQTESPFEITDETLSAAKLVSEANIEEITRAMELFDVESAMQFIEIMEGALVTDNDYAVAGVAKQFFTAVHNWKNRD